MFGTESINIKIPNHYVVYQKPRILSTMFQQIYTKEKGIANYIQLIAVRQWGYTWVLHAFFNQSKLLKKNTQQKWTLCFWVWEWASSVCKLTTRGISVGYSWFFNFDCRKMLICISYIQQYTEIFYWSQYFTVINSDT